jgi:hypothetical protein
LENNIETGINNIEMEKSGRLQLSQLDLAEFKSGRVSERLQGTWGFTYDQLAEIINNKNYEGI